MTWTSAKPTVPGLYLWRYGPGYPSFQSQCLLRRGKNGLWYKYANHWHSVERSAWEWAGPLTPPEDE